MGRCGVYFGELGIEGVGLSLDFMGVRYKYIFDKAGNEISCVHSIDMRNTIIG